MRRLVDRSGFGWPFDFEAGATEHEEVEVELPRTPATAAAAAERALESLQRGQQRQRAARWVRPGRDLEADHGVAELGLVHHPDRLGGVEAGDTAKASVGKRSEGSDRGGQRPGSIAEIRSEADVGADPTACHGTSNPAARLDRMVSRPVTVLILHPDPGPTAGPIDRWVGNARSALAERHRRGFVDAGAADVDVVRGPPDDTPFGARLRALVRAGRPAGLVVLGSGAIPLAGDRDYRDLVAAAGLNDRVALANNRYSADVVAIACAAVLHDMPDLPGDNALPRWLAEVAGFRVMDLRRRWRLAFDIDGPLELVLLGARDEPATVDLDGLRARMAAVRAVAMDQRAELVVTGRTSAETLGWLERSTTARTRAIVEERGLRAATRMARAGEPAPVGAKPQRPPSSLLGAALDRDGPGAFGQVLTRLGDAAIVDTRVLLAHRLGPDEATWPAPEDRYASDLMLPDRVADPWLRELTASAIGSRIPILLGGHSLVGPGIRLLLGRSRRQRLPWT